MTLKERIEGIIGNMEAQGGYPLWDDIEKMEHVLAMLIKHKTLQDEFDFVPDHGEVIREHLKELNL